MPYVSGSDLGGATGGPSAIIESIRTEIDSKMTGVKGVDWIERRYAGTVGGQNIEYWVEIPAAKTFNGHPLIIGFGESPAGTLNMNTSHLSWVSMTTGVGAGTLLRMDGQPMDKATNVNDATQDADAPYIDNLLLATGAAYLSHWVITSTDFGVDTPSKELSLYFVVEVAAGRYVKLGFWELEQFGDWSADAQDATAGFGIDCDSTGNEGSGIDDRNGAHSWFLSSQYNQNPANDSPRAEPGTMYIPHSQIAKWGSLPSPWATIGSKALSFQRAATIGLDWGLGRKAGTNQLHDHLRSVSVSTGIAQRLPARVYLFDSQVPNPTNAWPVGTIPNVYFVNISALNPGTVETFGGEDFLVVPRLEKNLGTFNTGNDGLLFRL